jgi:hypothetical protein
MCKGMELAFNQEHQAFYVPRCPSVNIFGVDPSVLMQGITHIIVCHMSFHVNIDTVFFLKCHLCVSLFFLARHSMAPLHKGATFHGTG